MEQQKKRLVNMKGSRAGPPWCQGLGTSWRKEGFGSQSATRTWLRKSLCAVLGSLAAMGGFSVASLWPGLMLRKITPERGWGTLPLVT